MYVGNYVCVHLHVFFENRGSSQGWFPVYTSSPYTSKPWPLKMIPRC